MIPIKHLMHINVKIEEVFSAISDENKLKEWYTTGVVGNFEKNKIVSFEFVNFTTFKFKIIAFEPNQSIHFECIESEWDNIGPVMKYDLDENETFSVKHLRMTEKLVSDIPMRDFLKWMIRILI